MKQKISIKNPLVIVSSITLFLSLILFGVILPTISTREQQQNLTQQALGAMQFTHSFAAFSAGSSPSVAASVGLNAILDYGYNPVAGDSKSTALKAANLQIIDQMPDKYTRQFNSDGNLQALLTNLTNHLKSVQNNTQIVAYWMLDDWSNDGTAKTALQQMTALIHQYTPGKPTICGFSGNSDNYNGKTKNFSPTGCDMVGLYIYPQSASEYTMPSILPALEAGLKAQGWDINANPLVGVPLSYGGANGYTVPTAEQVETQAKAFCQAGATSLIWYDFGTGTNGSNNSGIQQGIKAGIADCKAIWGQAAPVSTQPTTSALTPTVAPTSIYVTPTIYCLGSCPTGSVTPGVTNQPTFTPVPSQSQATPTQSQVPTLTPTPQPTTSFPTTNPTPTIFNQPTAFPTQAQNPTPTQGQNNNGNGNNNNNNNSSLAGQLLQLLLSIITMLLQMLQSLFK